MDGVLTLHPASPGLIQSAPEIYRALLSQWHSNEPILYKAGVRKSSWAVRQASYILYNKKYLKTLLG